MKQLIFINILVFWGDIAAYKLPSYLNICHRNDPNLEKCVQESMQKLKHLLKKGIAEFGIPSCEPLKIPEITIDQGTGSVAVKSTYKNIKLYGPSEFVIKNVNIDLNKDRVKIKVWLPHLEVRNEYTMDGRILMMPIKGSGHSYGNYSDIDATISIQGQKIKKDGLVYFSIKDFYVDFNIGHATVHLDNLFNGDKEMGEAMNLFLNDNWKQVSSEIKPILEDTIANLFKKFANKIFHKYPLDVLLPK